MYLVQVSNNLYLPEFAIPRWEKACKRRRLATLTYVDYWYIYVSATWI
jgi:hypothetical protein